VDATVTVLVRANDWQIPSKAIAVIVRRSLFGKGSESIA
jgi:hypothetical protein